MVSHFSGRQDHRQDLKHDRWAPPSELLIEQITDEAWELAFLPGAAAAGAGLCWENADPDDSCLQAQPQPCHMAATAQVSPPPQVHL